MNISATIPDRQIHSESTKLQVSQMRFDVFDRFLDPHGLLIGMSAVTIHILLITHPQERIERVRSAIE